MPLAPGVAATPSHDARTDALRRPFSRYVWTGLLAACWVALWLFALYRDFYVRIPYGDHYLYLAEHLVRGELSVDNIPADYVDSISWNGHKYLPFGLLPAVALVPFLPFIGMSGEREFSWVGHLYSLLNVFLFWAVLGRAGVTGERRRWALLLFFGGTIYFAHALVSNSWYFAHVITITFLLLATWEVLGRRRLVLVGLYLGLAALSRFTALFALPFFLWLAWRDPPGGTQGAEGRQTGAATNRRTPVRFLQGALLLALGLAGPLIVMALYNYARFGSVFESGYALAELYHPVLREARDYGLFSVEHVPKNLFMMLLQGPLAYPSQNAPTLQFPYLQPSPWGMGLLFTTPALLYAFLALRSNPRQPLVTACWLGIFGLMIPIITYYGIGLLQFGYRYALDFLLFACVLAALGLPKPMTTVARLAILASVLINIWGAAFLISWMTGILSPP